MERDNVLSLSDRGLAALSEPGSAGVLPFERLRNIANVVFFKGDISTKEVVEFFLSKRFENIQSNI